MSESEITIKDTPEMITRREAVLRVSAILGGAALIGGTAFITGCRDESGENQASSFAPFTTDEIAFLDEVADTILPTTSTPGAKAAKTGALMAVIVTDSYKVEDQKAFRDGMTKLNDRSVELNKVAFMQATPQQRLSLLEILDREQKTDADTRQEEQKKKKEAEKFLNDQRQEAATDAPDASPAPAITADPPRHYFRMMKELALLGYFTSEIGATQALRYVESPGRYDPCVPYTPGEKAWASHA